MGPNILLYFVKYPTPGKVKTRLAKTVGDQEAAKLYSELAEENLRVIASLHQRNICDLVITFDPPEKREDIKRWLSLSYEYLPQCGEGLSERLTHAFHEAFQRGGKRVMALGSDTLGLTAQIIEEGFECLKSNDVVIGPAEDGGYYLIGSANFQPKLFEGMSWSTNEVLPQTYKAIRNLRLSCQTLCQLEDLDEIKSIIKNIEPEILDKFYGCGSPIPKLLKDCTVLDLGCGTGWDVYVVSKLVGENGVSIGVDMTDEQLAVAFILDDHHTFVTGKPLLVCGNTALMISNTRFGKNFKIVGDTSKHFGLFPCGPVSDESNSSGSCC